MYIDVKFFKYIGLGVNSVIKLVKYDPILLKVKFNRIWIYQKVNS